MGKINNLFWNVKQEVANMLHPRDKAIVLMGAWFGKRFADNSRYLFQYLSENKEKLGLKHVVWVTRSEMLQKELEEMGYEAYMMDSDESLYYHKRAGVHIICNYNMDAGGKKPDILTQYSNGAIKINLWHGLGGIKGVIFASKEYLDEKKKHPFKYALKDGLHSLKWYRKYVQLLGGWADSYYLSTTPYETTIFQKYFQLPKKNFIESGYPRNEKLVTLRECEKTVLQQIQSGKKVILYMPTFREDNNGYTAPLSNLDLVKTLEDQGWLWIEKKHGADHSNLLNAVQSDAVLQLDADFDANIILNYVDLIVTDYSSVSWDALYHKKPVVFYMPDFDYYMNKDRGFVLSPEEFIIGPAVYDVEQLNDTLLKYKDDFSEMLPENEQELFERFWGEETNCEKIWQDIQKQVRL